MSRTFNFIACDCGNSTVRIMLCTYNDGSIKVKQISSEPNIMISIGDYFYWDIMRVFDLLKIGIRKALKQVDKIDSIGVCTWGVDFALFDNDGFMLGNPLSYRNSIGEAELNAIPYDKQAELFFDTGISCDKINSLYMIKGMQKKMPGLVDAGKKLLMVPDILNYFFTGVMENEPSEMSTSQLFDTVKMEISEKICTEMNIPVEWFSKIGKHGTLIANLRPQLVKEFGIDYDIPVVCVPSHDTACAVLGTPAEEEEFAFISSGTWNLIGAECLESVITQEVLDEGFTNEVGAFERITLLKNSIGMFIHQRLKPEYEEYCEHSVTWEQLNSLALNYTGKPVLFDVNSTAFFNPPCMSIAIWEYLKHTGQVSGNIDWGIIMSSFLISMAASYAQGIAQIERSTERSYEKIYLVGGGSKITEITQRAANITGKTFYTCDMECSSMGNALAQLKYALPETTQKQLKEIAVRSLRRDCFTPICDESDILLRYNALCSETLG